MAPKAKTPVPLKYVRFFQKNPIILHGEEKANATQIAIVRPVKSSQAKQAVEYLLSRAKENCTAFNDTVLAMIGTEVRGRDGTVTLSGVKITPVQGNPELAFVQVSLPGISEVDETDGSFMAD